MTYDEICKLFSLLAEHQELGPHLADMVLHNVIERLKGWRSERATLKTDEAGDPS